MSNDILAIIESISYFTFFIGLNLIVIAMIEHFLLPKKRIIKFVFEFLTFIAILLSAIKMFHGDKQEILQSISFFCLAFSFAISILQIFIKISEVKPIVRYFLFIGLCTFILSPLVYFFVYTNKKVQIIKVNKYLSVFNLANFYEGKVVSKKIGTLYATLDIPRIAIDKDEVRFNYSMIVTANKDLLGTTGIGNINRGDSKINFSSDNIVCDMFYRNDSLIFESVNKNDSTYWFFARAYENK